MSGPAAELPSFEHGALVSIVRMADVVTASRLSRYDSLPPRRRRVRRGREADRGDAAGAARGVGERVALLALGVRLLHHVAMRFVYPAATYWRLGQPHASPSSAVAAPLVRRRWHIRVSGSREDRMKASVFYRIAAVLLLFFAIGHTLGFRQPDPAWRVDALLNSIRSIHFDVLGFNRSYWDFFVAAGYCVGIFYLFAAILAWQLGGLPPVELVGMRGTAWAFALSFAAITVVSWRYLFIIPIAFSALITLCLTAAAWLSARSSLGAPSRS